MMSLAGTATVQFEMFKIMYEKVTLLLLLPSFVRCYVSVISFDVKQFRYALEF